MIVLGVTNVAGETTKACLKHIDLPMVMSELSHNGREVVLAAQSHVVKIGVALI